MRSSRLGLVLAASMAGLSLAFLNKAGPALKQPAASAARRLGALRMAGSDDGVGWHLCTRMYTPDDACAHTWLTRSVTLRYATCDARDRC